MRNRIPALLILLLPLAAWGSLGPRYGGELRIAIRTLPQGLEPQPGGESGERLARGLVSETLVRIGSDGRAAPSLASSWTRRDRLWTFSLEPGLTFHDGQSVTSRDAVRSLRRFLRSPSVAAEALAAALDGGPSFRGGATSDLPGMEDPDPQHLVLHSVGPLPLAALASPAAALTSEGGAGAGPFMPTVAIPGRSLAATAFLGHVRGRPFLDRVVLSRSERGPATEFRSRGADLAEGEQGLATHATLLLVLDPGEAPFQSAAARAAVRRVIEGPDLAGLAPGSQLPTGLLPPDLLPPLPDGPLPESGPTGGALPLAVARDVPPLASQRVVALLGSIGFRPEVTVLSSEGVREARHGARLLLFSPEVPEAGLALLEVSALIPGPRAGIDPDFDEPDPNRRREALESVEAALRQELVAIPLLAAPVSFGVSPSVHGARIDGAGKLLLEDTWFEP